MSRSKATAILFYLGAVLIGAAVGVYVDRTLTPARLNLLAQDPHSRQERFYSDMGFTQTQRTAWDSISAIRQRADSVLMIPVRAQMQLLAPQRDSLRETTNASLRALLTPEQLKLFDNLRARRQRPNDGRR